ncbi:MAG: PIN domain-containing protein [Candidatus Moranbacteria bacterium]|nr:PIN domain-containing protein [Candidatus Moranbacteria bacterium]
MAAKIRLQDSAQLVGRNIFVDANVLIYLFWPTGQHFYEQNYARVFRNLLRQGNNLFVDFLVISEIVNRAITAEWEKYLLYHSLPKNQLKYKEYYNSQDGRDAINDIYIIVKQNILSRFNVIGKSFSQQDIENFLIVDELGFVDKGIASICLEHNFVLLTNDKDFKNSEIDILTGNPHILS